MKQEPNSRRQGGKRAGRALAFVAACVAAVAAQAGSVSYTYDALGRLASATYSNGLVLGFQYDAAGNRTSYVISGAAP